jgi:cyclophilin family peptidyl-prolyl cis-trans isomerase
MKRVAPVAIVVPALLLAACEPAKNAGAPKPPASAPARSPEPPEAPPATAPAEPAPAVSPPAAPVANQALLDPSLAVEKAPEQFRVKLTTTKGEVTIEVTREWSPNGADRFYNLVRIGYFTDLAFFRVVDRFMAQFGIHGDPRVNVRWREAGIPDDEVRQSNQRGYLTFAKSGRPNSRTTQLFINLVDNPDLDAGGFSPIGRVVAGLEVVDSLYHGYGDGPPEGAGPNQMRVQAQGNAYLRRAFPELDYVKSASIIP